jgi:hypothetical protein
MVTVPLGVGKGRGSAVPIERPVGALAILWTAGTMLLLDGGLMLGVGSGALLPPGPPWSVVPFASTLAGVASLATLTPWILTRSRKRIARGVPRLFPFAPVPVNLGIFILIVLSAVVTVQAVFEAFVGAHNGFLTASTNWSGVSNAAGFNTLVVVASIVIWLLATYTFLAMGKGLQVGRYLEGLRPLNVYGHAPEVTPPPRFPRRWRIVAPPDPVPGAGRARIGLTLLLAAGLSAAVQILEAGTVPPASLAWIAFALFTPVWVPLLAVGIGRIDGAVRHLEGKYSSELGRRSACEELILRDGDELELNEARRSSSSEIG